MEILDSRGCCPTSAPRRTSPAVTSAVSPRPHPARPPSGPVEGAADQDRSGAGGVGDLAGCRHPVRPRADRPRRGGEHVEAEAEGRDATLLLRARYLVACDGEDSTVRRLADAEFPARTPAGNCCAPTSRASRCPTGASNAWNRAWPSRRAAMA
ncbi:FAD-dependent monooxygenase [Streptomyces sp. M10(2022)]